MFSGQAWGTKLFLLCSSSCWREWTHLRSRQECLIILGKLELFFCSPLPYHHLVNAQFLSWVTFPCWGISSGSQGISQNLWVVQPRVAPEVGMSNSQMSPTGAPKDCPVFSWEAHKMSTGAMAGDGTADLAAGWPVLVWPTPHKHVMVFEKLFC